LNLLFILLQRYRALFALRNKGGADAVAALGEAFTTSSALLKHEVAYVMGQMQHPASAAVLGQVLQVGCPHCDRTMHLYYVTLQVIYQRCSQQTHPL